MEGLQIAVLIGVLLIVGGALAARTRVPDALVLLVLGIAIGFVPAVDEITLPPEVVLALPSGAALRGVDHHLAP